jgi:hypothetical protein
MRSIFDNNYKHFSIFDVIILLILRNEIGIVTDPKNHYCVVY